MQATKCTLLPKHSAQCLFLNYTEEKKSLIQKKIKKKNATVCPRNAVAPPLDNHQRKMPLDKKG